MTELRDSAIWAATCDLKAQVLPNARRPLLVASALPGVVVAAVGVALLVIVPAVVGAALVAIGFVLLMPVLAVRGGAGHLMLESDGFTYRMPAGRTLSRSWHDCAEFAAVRSRLPGPGRAAGRVTWSGAGGASGGAFLPGVGGLPPEDLAVLLNRYRARFAPDAGPSTGPSAGPSAGPPAGPGTAGPR